jgi:hypothetical protein
MSTHTTFAAMIALATLRSLAGTPACLPVPTLAASWQSTQVWLDVTGIPGLNYAIEFSEDLAHWTRFATNRSSSGPVRFSCPISLGLPGQFFRARSVDAADGLGASFIFDGQTFDGWENDLSGTFRIKDCAMVGGSLVQALPAARYLCTMRSYTNFILRLEFKVAGLDGLINSGVQFRSQRVSGSQAVSGYQADLGAGYWGNLYDQSRRNTTLAAANQAAVSAVFKPNDWNSLVIRAEGLRIRIWINDYQSIDYTETLGGIANSGVIGLQVHSGGRFEASFRYLSLEVLP